MARSWVSCSTRSRSASARSRSFSGPMRTRETLSPPCPPCSTKARKPFLLRKACKSSAFFLVEKLPSWITHAAASGALVAGAVGAAAGAVFTGGAGAAPFATGVEGETGFRLPAPLLERQDARHEALRRRLGHAAAMSPPFALAVIVVPIVLNF